MNYNDLFVLFTPVIACVVIGIFLIRTGSKEHYKTIDSAVEKGELSINSTHDEIKEWIRKYELTPSESQIRDTINHIQRSHTNVH